MDVEKYIGKRVVCDEFGKNQGTVISYHKLTNDCLILVEFDEYFSSGHNGNRVTDVVGKDGHCWWLRLEELKFVNHKLRIG